MDRVQDYINMFQSLVGRVERMNEIKSGLADTKPFQSLVGRVERKRSP